MPNDKRNLETIPVGSLGLIPLESCKEIGEKVNSYLIRWRVEREHEHQNDIAFRGYLRDSYIMKATNLILLTEDDYNQLAETIANRVIQQLQGKTHNVKP